MHLLSPAVAVHPGWGLSGCEVAPRQGHSAEDWEQLLLPEIQRGQKQDKEVVLRADAAFARPEVYAALEERGVKHAKRIPANDSLEQGIGELLTRPAGSLGHAGELFPRVGFIVTNLEANSRAVAPFYDKHGTAEQRIKEGTPAVKMTRLSCHRFRSNEVRLWLSVIAHTLGNLWRRPVLPSEIDGWYLTSLQRRLVKTGGRLVKHARYYWLMLAESHLTRRLFGSTVRRVAALPVPLG